MRILLIGGGGREHALALKLSQSPHCEKLFITPGNAGTAACGINLDHAVNDFPGIKKTCIQNKIDLVIVGPEEPLVKGITDYLIADPALKDLDVIGPDQISAQLEGSKAFAKRFMMRHHIPTASYREFTIDNYNDGMGHIKKHPLPVVIKADGLAAGKGVVICQTAIEALAEYEVIIQRAKFGEAGKKVVIEEFLDGTEISVFVLFDGKNYVLLPEAKDYKRAGDQDSGLNTGGMGAISPVPFADPSLMKKIQTKVIQPTIDGLKKEGLEYRGFIFFGLMIVKGEPYMIEYNCRLGDPETEVILPRLKNDLVELFEAAAKQELDKTEIITDPRTVCTTVAVSGGYPGEYETGFPITGMDKINPDDSILFHMGTKKVNGNVVTSGGRVLCISSYGKNVMDAAEISRLEMQQVKFSRIYFRQDIGYEFE
jgi:phosphoribosylamine---glycine ligase